MDLEYVLLGLIRLHQGVTGYELNRIIKVSTGYLMSASLSHIYPTLKKLHDRGLVTYRDIPLNNRPDKKVYKITPAGDEILNVWLEGAVESDLDIKPFCLKMSFSPLMTKETILRHINQEIAKREKQRQERERGIRVEVDYLDKDQINLSRAELLWNGIFQLLVQTEDLQTAWLKEWRQSVEQGLNE